MFNHLRRNRAIQLCAVGAVSALLVAACSSSGSSSSSSSSSQAAAGATYTLTGSCPVPENTAQCSILEYTAKDATALSGGKLQFKLSYNSALGTAAEVQTLVQQGTVQLAVTSTSDVTALVPQFDIFNLPFLFATYDDVHKVTAGPAGTTLTTDLSKSNMKILAWEDEGFSDLLSKSSFVSSKENLKGQKVRVINDPLLTTTYSSLGSVPVPTASTEVYTGFETGEFAFAPLSPSIILANKWQEVAKYLTVINGGLGYTENMLVGSSKYLSTLPANLAADLQKAAAEATQKANTLNQNTETSAVNTLKADGVKFSSMSSSNVASWKSAAVADVYPVFTNKYGTSLLNEAKASISG